MMAKTLKTCRTLMVATEADKEITRGRVGREANSFSILWEVCRCHFTCLDNAFSKGEK